MAHEQQESFLRNKSRMLGTALVLILLAFFALNFGVRNVTWLYWPGLGLLLIGFLLPPVSRFTAGSKEEQKDEAEEGGAGKEEGN